MQWLFERYWNAQRAALDAVREKATERVAELIAAEAAWRARLEREKGAVKANRGRAATAAKKKSHQKSKKSHRQNADDDDSSSSSDDDAVTGQLVGAQTLEAANILDPLGRNRRARQCARGQDQTDLEKNGKDGLHQNGLTMLKKR